MHLPTPSTPSAFNNYACAEGRPCLFCPSPRKRTKAPEMTAGDAASATPGERGLVRVRVRTGFVETDACARASAGGLKKEGEYHGNGMQSRDVSAWDQTPSR